MEWLLSAVEKYGLPDSGKALRCCVNFVAQNPPATKLPEALGSGDTVVSQFEFSDSQRMWLVDLASREYASDISVAVEAIIRHCAEHVNSSEVFEVVRCKSKTPATCEGAVEAQAQIDARHGSPN